MEIPTALLPDIKDADDQYVSTLKATSRLIWVQAVHGPRKHCC
ncbi:hypothetical protein [Blautia sp. 1033sp1_1033st1_G9_1033SCRN_220408]